MANLINADGRDVTSDITKAIKSVIGQTGIRSWHDFDFSKSESLTTANGLMAFNLEAPAKELYPVLTPLRNRVPRKTQMGGMGVNWIQVNGIVGSGVISMPWVPEGHRAASIKIRTEPKAANFVSLGEESDVTFEAQSAGQGFEDVLATTGARGLQSLMIKEEYAITGGNRSLDLGSPSTPTTASEEIDDASLPAGNYNVLCIPLTLEGYVAASLVDGVQREVQIIGKDGKTFFLNGGSGKAASASSPQAVASGEALQASVPSVRGAIAYAWYAGASGNESLQTITTINSMSISKLTSGTQAFAAITDSTVDRSRNSDKAFDGLLYSAFGSELAYFHAMPTGKLGKGTPLTASGRGSVLEIDIMLFSLWENFRISPDEILVSAQELTSITNKALTGTGAPLVQFSIDVDNMNPRAVAGQVIGWYFNPYSMNGGKAIPIRLHPHMANGTLMAWCQNLPGYYESANVPETAEMICRRDYYQIPWPIHTRANETGVYCEEVLTVKAPFALAVITNIGTD